MDKLFVLFASTFVLFGFFPLASSIKVQDIILSLSLSISPLSHIIIGYFYFKRSLSEVDSFSKNNVIVWKWDKCYYSYQANSIIHVLTIVIIILFICFIQIKLRLKLKVEHGEQRYSSKYFIIELYTYNNKMINQTINFKEIISQLNIMKDSSNFLFSSGNDNLEKYLKNIHAKECWNHFPFYPLKAFDIFCKFKKCNWRKYNIYSWVPNQFYFHFGSNRSLKNIAYLNRLGIHFFTPFSTKPYTSILNSGNCCIRFFEIFQDILEVLILREEGLSLIHKYMELVNEPYKKLRIIQHSTKKTFKIWPPPLWYFSLKNIRIGMRNKSNLIIFNNTPEYFKDFIDNPLENRLSMDILSVFHLKYQQIWIMKDFRYGLFEDLKAYRELVYS